jgi:hypothetical protein
MFNKIKRFFEYAAAHGLNLPAAYDKDKDGPSMSLFFAYLAFFCTLILIVTLSIQNIELGVLASIIYSTLQTVFYLLRRLSKAKIDLDDKAIELEGSDK